MDPLTREHSSLLMNALSSLEMELLFKMELLSSLLMYPLLLRSSCTPRC